MITALPLGHFVPKIHILLQLLRRQRVGIGILERGPLCRVIQAQPDLEQMKVLFALREIEDLFMPTEKDLRPGCARGQQAHHLDPRVFLQQHVVALRCVLAKQQHPRATQGVMELPPQFFCQPWGWDERRFVAQGPAPDIQRPGQGQPLLPGADEVDPAHRIVAGVGVECHAHPLSWW